MPAKLQRAAARFKSYWAKVILAFDLFLNVCWGGQFGVTISSRVGLSRYWWEREVGKSLNIFQADHVDWARVHDEQRAIAALKFLGWDTSNLHPPTAPGVS
jgi:hypothetical protein